MRPTGIAVAVGTAERAARGMEANRASAEACTTTRPPARTTSAEPTAPSSSIPDSTTATTRGPAHRAALANITSIAGRWRFTLGPLLSRATPSAVSRWKSGGAT